MVKGKSPKSDIAETSSSAEIESMDDFKRVNESIKEISCMIDNLKPKGTFETQVKLVLRALSKHVEVLSTNCSAMSACVDTVESNLAKTDQYSRRSQYSYYLNRQQSLSCKAKGSKIISSSKQFSTSGSDKSASGSIMISFLEVETARPF